MTDRSCSVEGCERTHEAQGLCMTHYSRSRRGIPLERPVTARGSLAGQTCDVEECDSPAFALMLCKRHHDLEYKRRVASERRAAWIESQGGRCTACGSVGPFEIDHVNPVSKSIEVAAVWLRRAEIRDAELAKCQVLCIDCHRAKNATEQALSHGPRGWRRGCRCSDCRAAMNRQLDRARKTLNRY